MKIWWQPVLDEFARAREPMTWELPELRLSPVEKYEAVLYLLEHDMLVVAGRIRQQFCDSLYVITPTGRFMHDAGFTLLKRRKGVAREHETMKTLAERTVEISPTHVFDLARVPWTYSIRQERLQRYGEE